MLALAIAAVALQGGKPAIVPFDVSCRLAPTRAYDSRRQWLELPIKAVCTSDSDGSRVVPITPEEIQRGLVFANAAYARARVRFVFDPKKDFLRVRSTVLNRTEAGDVESNQFCQQVAEKFPGYVTLFFRWGAGKGPTGGCYSGFAGKYVMMCQFWDSPPPTPQTVWLIGHEVGHYLGLDHTFGRSFDKVAEAEAYFKEKKDDPSCFDGDGLADTGPDPCISEIGNDVTKTVLTLDGKQVKLDRENVMNYMGSRYKTMSRTQALRVRWSVENKVHRWQSNLPSNTPGPQAFAFKALQALSNEGSQPFTTLEPFENGIMHGDGRVTCYARLGSTLTYELPKVEDGTYDAILWAYTSTDLGIVQLRLDGKPLGGPVDLWNPITYMPTGALPLGRVRLAAGVHRLTVAVVGRNRESTNYHWSIEALELRPVKAER